MVFDDVIKKNKLLYQIVFFDLVYIHAKIPDIYSIFDFLSLLKDFLFP